MHRNRLAVAALVIAGLIATGCGSDDTEPTSDSQPAAAGAEKAKPRPKSHRAKMVECIENEIGSDVTPDADPNSLSVKNPDGKLQAVVVIHTDAGAARKAVAQTLGGENGFNAVTFGRAEFILRGASDTEAGVIANCVSIEYNRPG